MIREICRGGGALSAHPTKVTPTVCCIPDDAPEDNHLQPPRPLACVYGRIYIRLWPLGYRDLIFRDGSRRYVRLTTSRRRVIQRSKGGIPICMSGMSPLSPLIPGCALDVPSPLSAAPGQTVARPFDRNYMMDNNEAHRASCSYIRLSHSRLFPSMLTTPSRQPLIQWFDHF